MDMISDNNLAYFLYLPIHPLLQFLAGFKKRQFLGLDWYLLPSFRIPADIAFIFFDMKTA